MMDIVVESRLKNIVVKMTVESAEYLPVYGTKYSAGADLKICSFIGYPNIEEFSLNPGEKILVSTGVQMEIPEGFFLDIRPRSGLSCKHGISIANTPGTIDSDYRGVIKLMIINNGNEVYHLRIGDRVVQAILMPYFVMIPYQVDSVDTETERSDGGFGSTGTN